MKNVTLGLHYAATYKRSRLNSLDEDDQKGEKTFVAFEIDKVPEKRPFLLSRDFVSLRPSKKNFLLFEVSTELLIYNRQFSTFEAFMFPIALTITDSNLLRAISLALVLAFTQHFISICVIVLIDVVEASIYCAKY